MDCLFCEILRGNIPAKIVYEDKNVIAFNDINPTAPQHVLFVPREHYNNINSASKKDGLIESIFKAIDIYTSENEIFKNGYRTVINTGKCAMQTVDHLHVHVIAGRDLAWPPG